MKKHLIIWILLTSLFLGGCSNVNVQTAREKEEQQTSMFVIIERTGTWKIVYHKDTKVMYAVSVGTYNNGTFTVLVNADGTPMIYEK